MWNDNLVEEIAQEFNDLQPETVGFKHFRDDPEYINPYDSTDVDMQEWHKHWINSTPISNCNSPSPLTCIRVIPRKWKNQHGEGKYFVTSENTSWGNNDYEEMENTPFTEIPEGKVREEKSQDDYLTHAPVETPVKKSNEVKTRIQLTLKKQSKNVRGSSDNFVIHGVTVDAILGLVEPIKQDYPKVKHSVQTVRVQLTQYDRSGGNYIKGQGGNAMFHNAEVSTIADRIRSCLDGAGLVEPDAAPGKPKLLKELDNLARQRGKSEDGSPKPAESLAKNSGVGGILYQSQKSEKSRASLREELFQTLGLV